MLLALFGCLVVASPVVGDETPEGLLAKARDGNRAAIAAIRTMECRYERVPWAGTTPEQAKEHFYLMPGRFWRSGDTYRLFENREYLNDGMREYLVRDGKMLDMYWGGPRPEPRLSIGPQLRVIGTGGEMWQYLLFSHWASQPSSFLPFNDILQEPHTVRAVERLPDRSNAIRVELTHDGATRLEFWFDPKANYLVRKSVMVPAGDTTIRWEHEVIAFAEPDSGVFVPTTIEVRCFVNGQRTAAIRTVITELKVNHDLPDSALRLSGIDGLECFDSERRVKYKVDADGNRVGPERPADEDRSPRDSAVSPLPSQPEPPWWEWALLGAAAILAVGIVWTIAHRFRNARPDAR